MVKVQELSLVVLPSSKVEVTVIVDEVPWSDVSVETIFTVRVESESQAAVGVYVSVSVQVQSLLPESYYVQAAISNVYGPEPMTYVQVDGELGAVKVAIVHALTVLTSSCCTRTRRASFFNLDRIPKPEPLRPGLSGGHFWKACILLFRVIWWVFSKFLNYLILQIFINYKFEPMRLIYSVPIWIE